MNSKPILYLVLATAGDLESYERQGFLERFLKQVDFYKKYFNVEIISSDKKNYSLRLKTRHRNSPFMPRIPILRNIIYTLFLILISIEMKRGIIRVFNVSNPSLPLVKLLSGNPIVASYHYDWVDQAKMHHNIIKWISAWVIERFVFTSLDFMIPMSKRLGNKLKRYGFSMEIIPNFVDPSIFYPSKKKKRQIIFIGRLERYKGVDILMKAVGEFDCNLPILIIGDGSDRNRLETLSKELNLKVIFFGYMEQKLLARHIRESYVLVLPTTTMEGNPKVILEAFSSGTSCIVTDIRGSREIVLDGVNGLIAKAGDVESMKKSIDILFSNDNFRKKISNNAFLESKKYSINNTLNKEVKILEEVLNDKKP